MSSVNEATTSRNESISELEMVGTLLFGSISDVSERTERTESTVETPRMVNLGARIAPETSRHWEEDSTPAVVLSAKDANTISEIVPERKKPAPVVVTSQVTPEIGTETGIKTVVEVEKNTVVNKTKTHSSRAFWLYTISLATLSCVTLVLGWQLFLSKNTGEMKGETAQVEQTAGVVDATVATTEPMVAPVAIPTGEAVPESAFAPMETEAPMTFAATEPVLETSVVANETVAVEEVYPSFNPNLGAMQPAQVNAVVGSAVAIQEEEAYPTFNANLANATPAYTSTDAPGTNQVTSTMYTDWNAGATMDEVPVFNSEISNFNAQPTYSAQAYSMSPMPTQVQALPTSHTAEIAPTTPQFGSQAQMPPAPRKLSAPSTPVNAPVSAPVATPVEETYPSFNPNLGVDQSLPVSYY